MEKNTKTMYILAIFIGLFSSGYFFMNAKSDKEKEEAKLSLNFEITYAIIAFGIGIVLNILIIVVPALALTLSIIALPIYLVLWARHAYIDFQAMKSVEAGKTPQFPLNFNLVK